MTIFSKNLQNVLKSKQVTKRALAEMLSLPEQNVGRWTTGKVIPRIDTLLRICECLEVTPNELLGYDKEKNL